MTLDAHQPGRPKRKRLGARIGRSVLAVVLTAMAAQLIFRQRGPVLGVAAMLLYGSVLLWWATSPAGFRRWSSEHIVADSAMVVPLTFFALLLIEPLRWWLAALIALGLGAVVVPLAVRRRRSVLAKRSTNYETV